jgi:hypothetical protein
MLREKRKISVSGEGAERGAQREDLGFDSYGAQGRERSDLQPTHVQIELKDAIESKWGLSDLRLRAVEDQEESRMPSAAQRRGYPFKTQYAKEGDDAEC